MYSLKERITLYCLAALVVILLFGFGVYTAHLYDSQVEALCEEERRIEQLVEDDGYAVIVDGVKVSRTPEDFMFNYNVAVIDEDKLIICTTE